MPHNHIFMQQSVVDSHAIDYGVARRSSIERFVSFVELSVAGLVLAAFHKFGLDLRDDQMVRYDLRVTNSMPVDMSVNITVWYTPERAPHFEAIRQEVLEQLQAWAPELNIEVHLVVVGQPNHQPEGK